MYLILTTIYELLLGVFLLGSLIGVLITVYLIIIYAFKSVSTYELKRIAALIRYTIIIDGITLSLIIVYNTFITEESIISNLEIFIAVILLEIFKYSVLKEVSKGINSKE